MEIFRKLYRDFRDSVQTPGIAFDIDDTLSDTNLYWANELIQRFGGPKGLSAKSIISQYKYCRAVPFWGEEEKAWVEKTKFSDKSLLEIQPVPGAVKAISDIVKVIPVIAYITSRPSRVAEVTKQWLDNVGLPSAQLLTYPSINCETKSKMNEYHWKAGVIEYLHPKVVGFVDDNSEVLSNISYGYNGMFYLYSDVPPPNDRISYQLCKDWIELKQKIIFHSKSRGSNT